MALAGAQKAAGVAGSSEVAIAATPNTIINGPLKDSYTNASQAAALARAEINQLIGGCGMSCGDSIMMLLVR